MTYNIFSPWLYSHFTIVMQQLHDRVLFSHTHLSSTVQRKRKNVFCTQFMSLASTCSARGFHGACLKSLRAICTNQSPAGDFASPELPWQSQERDPHPPKGEPSLRQAGSPLEAIPFSSYAWPSFPHIDMDMNLPLPVSLEAHSCNDCILLPVFFACVMGVCSWYFGLTVLLTSLLYILINIVY